MEDYNLSALNFYFQDQERLGWNREERTFFWNL